MSGRDYAGQSIDAFLAGVASEEVTPAGGTAAAVVGATGAALCEMVCIHTVAGEDAAAGGPDLVEVGEDLQRLRGELLDLADADAGAVEDLLAVYGDEDNLAEWKRATGVPLAVAEACLAVLESATTVTEHGNPNAVPDAVTGAFLAHGALRATVFTVRSNLDRVADPAFVEELAGRAADLERAGEREVERVLANGGADR